MIPRIQAPHLNPSAWIMTFRRDLTGAVLLAGLLAYGVGAQEPNLKESTEVWRGERAGSILRVWHLPKRPSTLIPQRFGLEEISTSNPLERTFQHFDRFEIRAVDGIDALHTYAARNAALVHWSDVMNEGRETFRAPGTYEVRFIASEYPDLEIRFPLTVTRHQAMSFPMEISLFISGCIVLGLILIACVLWLHRRARHFQPCPVQTSLPIS